MSNAVMHNGVTPGQQEISPIVALSNVFVVVASRKAFRGQDLENIVAGV